MLSQSQVQANLFEDPGDTEVVVFEATNRLTGFQGNQLWMGATGVSKHWGSCNVLASADGTTYAQVGTINTIARLGTVDSTFASGSDPDTTNSLVVDLVENSAMLEAGTAADADSGNTLLYVDGEIVGYSAAAISGPDQYTLDTYIRRGMRGSAVASHAAGTSVLRLDDNVFKFTYDPTWAGKTIYLKFQSVNTFGNAAQDVSTLTPLTLTITGQNTGVPAAHTTAIVNPDFEIDSSLPPYGWLLVPMSGGTRTYLPALRHWIFTGGGGGTSTSTPGYDTSTPYAGSRSLTLTCTGSSPLTFASAQAFAVQPGDSYQLTAALKLAAGGAGAEVHAKFSFQDASGASISGGASDIVCAITTVGGWSLVTASGVVPAGAVTGVIYLGVVTSGTTTGEWDSLKLIRMPNLSSDVAGTLPIASVGARSGSIAYVIDGAGSVVSTGIKGHVSVPANCTVNGWVITADQSGSAVVDVLRSTYSGFPTVASIAGTDKPTLSSAQKNQNAGPLSAWGSTALTAGDILQFSVSSCSTCTRLIVTLNVSITG